MRFLPIAIWLLKKYLGVEIKRENFEKGGIIPAIAVIVVAYLTLGPMNFFSVIDSMIELSKQQWYFGIMAKLSFSSIFVKIIFLSLFTRKNDPIGRFTAAFTTQILGLVGTTVCHILLNSVIVMPNIDSQIKIAYGLLPFLISVVVFFVVDSVYRMKHFDRKKFFGTKDTGH